MSPVFYHIAHLVGLILLFIGFGGLLSGDAAARRSAMKFHGIGLVILLVAGFGLIAKIGPTMPGVVSYTAPFIIVKLVIFLILGFLPVLAKRKVLSGGAVVGIAVVLAGCSAYLGHVKALPF